MIDHAHAHADAETGHEERIPVDLTRPIVLEVHNPNGEVTIRAAERDDVLVGYVLSGPADDVEMTINDRDNRIDVRSRPRAGAGWAGMAAEVDLDAVVGQIARVFGHGGAWSSAKAGKARVFSGGQGWCDMTIDVPRAMSGRVEVHCASGDVRIEGVTSEVALTTMSGDVRAVRTGGELVLQSASGDLTIEGVSGRLNARTASGDVHVISAQLSDVQIQTASGDIVLDALLSGAGPYRAQSASGDVRLTLRRPGDGGEEPAATLAFQTVSGDAHVTPPFRKTARRAWRAGAGDEGGARIDVTTVSGDLSAGFAAAERGFGAASSATPTPLADDVPPAPPVSSAEAMAAARPPSVVEAAPAAEGWGHGDINPAAPGGSVEDARPAARDEAARLAVLEAVERGEIDIEEALQRLEAADSTAGL